MKSTKPVPPPLREKIDEDPFILWLVQFNRSKRRAYLEGMLFGVLIVAFYVLISWWMH